MHKFINFNHQTLPAENILLSAASAAALYGRSIFTTVAVYNFEPFLWGKNWQRLTVAAPQIGIDFSRFTEQTIKNSLLEIIGRNSLRNGRARITFYDESPTAAWENNAESRTSLLIQTADFRQVKDKFNLTVSPFPINSQSPLAGIKSGNYLENILAWENARAKGFDEAIRLNEKGEIAAACLANVFWKKDGAIFTPSLAAGCLEGTTRGFILENLEVKEIKSNLDEIMKADEIFLTSAGIGVMKAGINR